MNQFQFAAKQKTFFISLMVLGLLCLTLTWFNDDELHTRFWSNVLHNSVFFTGIAFVAVFAMSAFTMAYGGWYTVFKRIWEAYGLFLLVGLGLMAILIAGIWGHWHHLYHWADAEAVENDVVLKGKSSFLNPVWYTAGTFIIGGIWYLFARKYRSLSLDEDQNGTSNFRHHRKLRNFAAIFLPIGGFSSAAIIWQWVMSVDAHWYSTLFAWYTTASWFLSMVALTILLLIYLKSKGYFQQVTVSHMHDLGKYMFAFSIFWTYMWFSQFMLIWYGNVGEETIYFHERRTSYPVLFYGNLIINFFIPFLVLMRNDTKRKVGTLVFAAVLVFMGHWLDFFLMIKPGVRITAVEHLEHHNAAGHADAHEGAAHLPADAAHAEKAVAAEGHDADHPAPVDQHQEHTAEAVAHTNAEHAAETADSAPAVVVTQAPSTTDSAHVGSAHVNSVDAVAAEYGAGHATEAAHGDAHAEEGHHNPTAAFASGFTIPGLLELGTFGGFLGMFLFFVFSQLAKAPLVPKKDPYIVESLHHEV